MITNQASLTADELEFVSQLVRKEAAIVLGEAKRYLVVSRLQALSKQRGFPSPSALIADARKDARSSLCKAIVESLTTNETYFFRDDALWKYLRTTLIPDIIQRREKDKQLTFWCGASSTGQEPYSLAFVLDEFPVLKSWKVRLVATDLDENVVQRAQAGVYDHFEVNRGLPARVLTQHFERQGVQWRVKEAMRNRVEFRRANLIGPWGDIGRPDVILLRNVLIYFDQPTRRGILERSARMLHEQGNLILGTTEVSHPIEGLFRPVDRSSGVYALASKSAVLPKAAEGAASRSTTPPGGGPPHRST